MKATHKGECQLCGRTQLLPSGQLSKHGYTTRWGFFSGVCSGAHHLPFELSCDLIDGALESVRNTLGRLNEEIAELKQPAVSTAVQMKYESKKWADHNSYYRTAIVTVAPEDGPERRGWRQLRKGQWCYEWRGENRNTPVDDSQNEDGSYRHGIIRESVYAYGVDSGAPERARLDTATLTDDERHEVALEIATRDNQLHADYVLAPRAAKLEEYIGWLTDRKNTWTARELQAR